jgi:hypothetical protein
MARHPGHRRQHSLIENRLAQLVGGKINVDPDDLDHVPRKIAKCSAFIGGLFRASAAWGLSMRASAKRSIPKQPVA